MATKISKSQLKSIVKECLIEIMSESLELFREDIAEQKMEPRMTQKTESSSRKNEAPQKRNTLRGEKTDATEDMLSEILADTAETTYKKMMSAEKDNSNPRLAEQFSGDVEQIFGENMSSKWADLAFQK